MTRLITHVVTDGDTSTALARLGGLVAHAPRPALAFLFFGAGHDADEVTRWANRSLGGVPFIGGTSCRGVLVGGHRPAPADIALLAVCDDDGDYGVGAAPLDDDPAAGAAKALEMALASAGCAGELPAALWVFQPPGSEEQVIAGLRRIVGDRCPIVGGSAADDAVTGAWRQIASVPVEGAAVVVAALFPGKPVAVTFQSGYAPSGRRGTVTASAGRRIERIDGHPAALVYDGWTDHAIADRLGGGPVLAETSLAPLGLAIREVEGIVQHRLIHPANVTADGALETFAEVPPGSVLDLMTGSADGLARRAGRVLQDGAALLPPGSTLAGGLLVYCGGCMMAIGDEIATLVDEVDRRMAGAPVLGVFTFGEQGPIGNSCVHGNLMVSALVFAA